MLHKAFDPLCHPLSIQATATYYINAIKTVQPQGPYHLVGVSFGGLVAYEIAQQIRQQGDTVSLLGLLDSYCPVQFQRYRLQRMQRHFNNFRKQGVRYGLNKSQRLWHRLQGKLMNNATDVVPQANGRSNSWNRQEQEAYELLQPEMQGDVNCNYEFIPYPGEIELFRSQDDPDPKLNWRQLAEQGLLIHDIPGDHLGMLRDPNVQMIAQRLQVKLST
ncbi:MAG: hypothetical protein F6J87_31235 [Spirulina sp. SIO3F2]|nr:hypothetical protein [Spirulina sp. SIO3F2]